MVRIEQLAQMALSGDALGLRSQVQDWLGEHPKLADSPAPVSADPTILAVAAALVELFAERRGESPPPWAAKIGAAPRPIHLVNAARTMRRLRELCEAESPPSLRRRNLFAPPGFLEFV